MLWDDLYQKGYMAGYWDGVSDAANGKAVSKIEGELEMLPINAMNLSTRAYNCLNRAGCESIADVVALDGYRIATMRNLGPKTACEIAKWLQEHGIGYSAWGKYL